jgi:hypothetical protein
MSRSMPVAAIAMVLLASSAAAATDGNGNATLPNAAKLAAIARAGPPSYVSGGWVCAPGYAWRNAGRQDWLCVDPIEARRIAWENRNAAAKAAREPDGTYRCPPGLVARGASKGDDVCVEPARQEMVHQMNLALFDAH